MQCRLAAAHIRQCILAEVRAAVAVTWAAVDLDLIIEVSKADNSLALNFVYYIRMHRV